MAHSQVDTAAADPKAPTPARALQCMELVGGNGVRRERITGTGLDLWVDSRPLGGPAGGDIHYLSLCGGGHVTRLVLADVAGHGEVVADAARRLRRLMRKNMNTLDQTRFAQALNDEFAAAAEGGQFATALLATYFAPTQHLIVCNAGHPRPFWFRRDLARWVAIDAESCDVDSVRTSPGRYHVVEKIANLPLGILSPTDYEQVAVRLGIGDLVVLYTDAWIEARSPAGALLKEDGLLHLLERVGPADTPTLADRLGAALDDWRGGRPPEDDQTLVILEHLGGGVPHMTLTRATRSLLKILGILRV